MQLGCVMGLLLIGQLVFISHLLGLLHLCGFCMFSSFIDKIMDRNIKKCTPFFYRDDFNISVLQAFVELHEFADLNLVQALR